MVHQWPKIAILTLLGSFLLCGSVRGQAQGQDKGFFGGIIHGVNVGVGLSAYQGDVSRNPSNNVIKYIGQANLRLRVGADHRLGVYEQYGLGGDIVYSRISNRTSGNLAFQTNMIALDLYGDYELPYIKQHLFRVFLSVGPLVTFGSSYQGYASVDNTRVKSTRVLGSATLGVTVFDRLKIGMRATSSDYFDGYLGFDEDDKFPDFLAFVSLNYRFDFAD